MTDIFPLKKPKFNHAFSSCSRCYATLRFYHPIKSPDDVTRILEIQPTSQQLVGEPNGLRKFRISAWFFSTECITKSRDIRAHIWQLVSKVEKKKDLLEKLREQGWEVDIFCFWESATGNGGPQLDVETMSVLSRFQLELGFDIWF